MARYVARLLQAQNVSCMLHLGRGCPGRGAGKLDMPAYGRTNFKPPQSTPYREWLPSKLCLLLFQGDKDAATDRGSRRGGDRGYLISGRDAYFVDSVRASASRINSASQESRKAVEVDRDHGARGGPAKESASDTESLQGSWAGQRRESVRAGELANSLCARGGGVYQAHACPGILHGEHHA
jgi:hypothetical protein